MDDIKSTKNYSKLVDCDFSKQNKVNYNFVKKHFKDSSTTMNFNVYPKKDKNGTQDPINSSYEFIQHNPNDVFTGIYELTTETEDRDNSNNVFNLQKYIDSQWPPSYNNAVVENTIENNINGNNISGLEIDSNNILFNPYIREAFLMYRSRNQTVYENRLAVYNTKQNNSKKHNDPHRISKWDLLNSKLAILKGSLMIPDMKTETKLLGHHLFYEDEFNEFTRFNKKLFNIIGRRNTFEVTLDEIISIILNDNDVRYEDDIIILDFGCKHIRDLPYNNNTWDRPVNRGRESTVKLGYPLSKDIGPIWEPGDYKYYTNKLFEEAKD